MKNTLYFQAQGQAWLRSHAARGNAEAMLKLGLMYENGRGVTRNPAEAARWYGRAARAGEAAAMIRLGILHGNGAGVVKDRVEAAKWLLLARARGADAETALEKLSALMSPEELETAGKKAAEIEKTMPGGRKGAWQPV